MARRSRPDAAPLHRRGGLAAPFDLRHGHRPGRPLRQRLSGLRADLDGRHQAAGARPGRRPRPADLQGHRLSARRQRGAALHRRRRPALDRLAQRVPGRQQRRPARPVHLQGQRRVDAGLRRRRPRQPPARPVGRQRSSRSATRPASRCRGAAAAPRSSISTWTACSISWWSIARRRSASSAISASRPLGATRRSATGWRSSCSSRAPTATPSGRASPSRPATTSWTASSRSAAGTPRARPGFIHVGLGTAERAEIRMRWPDGEWSHTYRVIRQQLRADRARPGRRPTTGCRNRRRRRTPRSTVTNSARRVRLIEVTLPDFGAPETTPELAPGMYAARFAAFADRVQQAGLVRGGRLRRPRAFRQPRVADRVSIRASRRRC